MTDKEIDAVVAALRNMAEQSQRLTQTDVHVVGSVELKAIDAIAALRARITDLQQDAARYRVLRKPGAPENGTVFACVYVHAPGTIPSQKVVVNEELDRACDAAIDAIGAK
ncbi:hypothetical protein [Paraburkholderia caballeronis]|uniref:hypothetical protein n=1 Tax=Paraburkholderia caballeronis TaxID=416943 RepID=UPI00115FA55C|nr:hypothetical protein [Paraburkholderia caballeronis]